MKRKRLYAIIIATILTFGSAPSVLAADINSSKTTYAAIESGKDAATTTADEQKAKITKDDAKALAKKALKENFGIEIDETKFQTNISFRPNYDSYNQQGYIWDISWNQNLNQKSININASVDAISGRVTALNKYDSTDGQSGISTITEDKAKGLSDEFLKKVNPEEFKQVKILENNPSIYYYNPVSYSFNYVRMVNGIKYDGNIITVNVNGTTGKIVGYYYRWTDNLNLPSAEGIVEASKAEEAFRKQVKLNLTYVSYVDKYSSTPNEKSVKLVYSPDVSQAQFFDAKEGKMIDGNGGTMPTVVSKDLTADEKDAFYKGLKPLQVLGKEIDKDRATEVVKNALKELYGEGYDIDSINYSEGDNNYGYGANKVWSAGFRKVSSSDPKMSDGGQISIDALTESVVNLYKYNYSDNQNIQANYTWEQLYSKAVSALGNYYPDKAKEVNMALTNLSAVNGQV